MTLLTHHGYLLDVRSWLALEARLQAVKRVIPCPITDQSIQVNPGSLTTPHFSSLKIRFQSLRRLFDQNGEFL